MGVALSKGSLAGDAEILRFTQNDRDAFPLKPEEPLILINAQKASFLQRTRTQRLLAAPRASIYTHLHD